MANSTISVTRKADRDRDVLGRRWRVEVELDPQAARFDRRAGAQVGGQLGQQRAKRDAAVFLHLRIMVAMDHRQRIDPPADRRIGRLGLGLGRAAAMDAEQRGDDLEVVLDPVMDLADQPPLTVQRVERVSLGALDAVDRAFERLAQIADFGSDSKLGRQVQPFAVRLIFADRALQSGERHEEQPPDQQPAEQGRGNPHQHRQQHDDLVEQCRPLDRGDRPDAQFAVANCIGPVACACWPAPGGA